MKLIDIKKEISINIVMSHMANGWILDWDDASRGNKTTQFFTKDGQVRCLIVKEESGYGMELDKLIVRLVKLNNYWEDPCGGFHWYSEDDFEEVLVKTYFQADEDWYVENEEEATAILEKKREHIRSKNMPWNVKEEIKPSEALVDILRKRTGNDKLTAKNIRVYKHIEKLIFGGSNLFYKVEILNRLGNVKDSHKFKLNA